MCVHAHVHIHIDLETGCIQVLRLPGFGQANEASSTEKQVRSPAVGVLSPVLSKKGIKCLLKRSLLRLVVQKGIKSLLRGSLLRLVGRIRPQNRSPSTGPKPPRGGAAKCEALSLHDRLGHVDRNSAGHLA